MSGDRIQIILANLSKLNILISMTGTFIISAILVIFTTLYIPLLHKCDNLEKVY